STTAAVNTRIVAAPPDPEASARKLAAKTTPVMRENQAHDASPARANHAASTKHAPTRQAKPALATIRWTRPCQVTSPMPGGVPGGNPSDGSARKTPAATSAAPYAPSRPDAQADRRPVPRARRKPTAAAIVI